MTLLHVHGLCSADVLVHGSWTLMKDLEDPELKELAGRLPHTILHSRADSTVKKYCGAFKRWKIWAASHKLLAIPAKPHEFALYLQFIGEHSVSKSAVEEACNALSWVHSVSGLDSPTTHPLVKATLSGLQRTLAKPVVKKETKTIEMIEAVVRDAERSGSLSDLRLATACVLGYAGFLRFSELVNLTPADFEVSGEMMKIRIKHSKTDQLRQGDEVVIARTGSRTCPVAMFERYLQRVGMSKGDGRFLFRAIQRTKNGESLRESGSISYTCLRSVFLRKMTSLGFPAHEFGLHNMRSGGATATANANVPDRIFKRHGRWKSENAKDGYVKDSLENRLEVSRKIGLYLYCDAFFVALVVSIANCFGGTTPLDESLYACVLGCMGNQGMMWEVYFLAVERSELDRK